MSANGKFKSVGAIQRAHEKVGGRWFSPENMDFFRSRVYPGVYGGRFFVTSEKQGGCLTGNTYPRLYTVREATPDGDIGTPGEFQEFSTLKKAQAAAEELATPTEKEPTT
ncbi:hypothetical protein LCGC14_1938930 [marine sediment metagenome]|uniref:Uncharacterized protein n=1 Tax=marine sediment metagenome TaxID=412755 RepID=A0A0F9HZB5_9ZZZZ